MIKRAGFTRFYGLSVLNARKLGVEIRPQERHIGSPPPQPPSDNQDRPL